MSTRGAYKLPSEKATIQVATYLTPAEAAQVRRWQKKNGLPTMAYALRKLAIEGTQGPASANVIDALSSATGFTSEEITQKAGAG
jgi:hypothetical protein